MKTRRRIEATTVGESNRLRGQGWEGPHIGLTFPVTLHRTVDSDELDADERHLLRQIEQEGHVVYDQATSSRDAHTLELLEVKGFIQRTSNWLPTYFVPTERVERSRDELAAALHGLFNRADLYSLLDDEAAETWEAHADSLRASEAFKAECRRTDSPHS